jgi:hypothetical protein
LLSFFVRFGSQKKSSGGKGSEEKAGRQYPPLKPGDLQSNRTNALILKLMPYLCQL